MSIVSDDWISQVDDRLSQQGVSVKRRPWEALATWSRETGSLAMDSPEAKTIFDWYSANCLDGTFELGWLFTGALFFDEAVWPVKIPICFGTVPLSLTKMIDTMPALVQKRMMRTSGAVKNLLSLGADCIDYGFGLADLRSKPLPGTLADQFLISADKELRSSIEVLLSNRPTQKAAEAARMATEIFLKCWLAHHTGLTENAARKINHDLDEALNGCLAHDPNSDLTALQGQFGVFPTISDRYAAQSRPLRELWTAYSLAQIAGTCLIRSLTGRDARQQLRSE